MTATHIEEVNGPLIVASEQAPTDLPHFEEPMGTVRVPGVLAQITVLVRKDILLEARTREAFIPMAVFGLLVLVLFSFSFDLARESTGQVVSGILWTAILFAGMLGVGRGFALERDRGALDALLLTPIAAGTLYLARLVATLLLMLSLECVLLPAGTVLFNVPLMQPRLLGALALGTFGFSVVATLFAALAASSRARDVLLPLLMLPVLLPLIIAVVQATSEAIAGPGLFAGPPWLRLAAGFDVLFLIVSLSIFDFVIRDS